MILQGLTMGADDIDIVCDKKTALLFNDLFKKQILDEVKYSQTDKFKSYYGKFAIDKILVEVMGEWQIRKIQNSNVKSQNWGDVYDGSDDEVVEIDVDGTKVRATKLDLEMNISAQMGRWSEFHKIKKQIKDKQQRSLF